MHSTRSWACETLPPSDIKLVHGLLSVLTTHERPGDVFPGHVPLPTVGQAACAERKCAAAQVPVWAVWSILVGAILAMRKTTTEASFRGHLLHVVKGITETSNRSPYTEISILSPAEGASHARKHANFCRCVLCRSTFGKALSEKCVRPTSESLPEA